MRYRRARLKGGTFFFTVVTHSRRKLFASSRMIDSLRSVFKKVKADHPFDIDAIVILPEHIHCIWTLPAVDTDYSSRWRLIKSSFTRLVAREQLPSVGKSPVVKRAQPVWQRRFWEHVIRNDADFIRHVEYIHYNPVKHGLVKAPSEWPYSSFHTYVNQKLYDIRWGATDTMEFEPGIGME